MKNEKKISKTVKRIVPRRESSIERKFRDTVKSLHGLAVKNAGVGSKSMPDRTVYLKGGRCILVEVKAEGKEPTPKQWAKLYKFEKLGFTTFVIDSYESIDLFKEFVRNLLSTLKNS